jgi:NAD(P)H-quinone oxidoreductase subunit 5
MAILDGPRLTAALAAAAPLTLLAGGLFAPASGSGRPGRWSGRAAIAALTAFCFALAAAGGIALFGGTRLDWAAAGLFHLGVLFNPLSAVTLVLMTFVIAASALFARRHLAGDEAERRFARWFCLTGGSWLCLVVSGNLAQFILAWAATSACLHWLLVLYPGRAGATLAARKKLLTSFTGDLLLIAAIIVAWREFHTWDFEELAVAAARMRDTAPAGAGRPEEIFSLLVAAGVMMKSAQFPFHTWLPDTLETPAPVCALTQAGVVNAGGLLLLRLHPLFAHSPAALWALALGGAFTAVFAAVVMTTQASVRRALAFSTVAQTGCIMLECGSGAFGLALLHICAHALYKTRALLDSGKIVRPVQAGPAGGSRTAGGRLAYLLLAGAAGLATAFVIFLLRPGFNRLAGAVSPGYGVEFALVAVPTTLFVIATVVRMWFPGRSGTPRFRAVYVHARNGFYLNTLANRLVTAVWPVKSVRERQT